MSEGFALAMPEAPAPARSKIVGRLTEDGDVQAGAVLRFSPISGETYDVKCVHGQQVPYAQRERERERGL